MTDDCPTCDGAGTGHCPVCFGRGTGATDMDDCPECDGEGEISCDSCRGEGTRHTHITRWTPPLLHPHRAALLDIVREAQRLQRQCDELARLGRPQGNAALPLFQQLDTAAQKLFDA